MSQHDMNIANQSFPSFRSDLNNALSAIQTTHSGTSRPTGAVAGQIWLDTTSATSPTLKYYDGADDISLATIDHTANTVNWLDSTVSITGLTTTATGTVITLSDTANTSSVNLIIDNQKEVRFRETTANGTNYIGLKAPASVSADLTFVLPSADGTSGQFLKTDGAGNLSFASLSFATPLTVVGNSTAGSSIRLPEDTDNGSNYVALKAPDTLASDLTFTLPSADGTSGQVLQTNGSGVLSFSTPSAGSFVFLGETTASNVSSVSIDGYFTSSYDIYKIFVDGLYGASNDVGVRITVNKSGTEQTAADYAGSLFYQIATGSNTGSSSFDAAHATTYIFGAYSNSSSSQNITCFDMTLYNPLGTNNNKVITFLSSNVTGDFTRFIVAMGSGMHRVQSAISGITFKMGSGNIYARKIKIYGVKNT